MKAYTDCCNIKVSIKIKLIVFISTVFHKMLTTAVAYALLTQKQDTQFYRNSHYSALSKSKKEV